MRHGRTRRLVEATDRRTLLYAALAAVLVKRHTPELALVHSGAGSGLVSYPQGWRATFLHRSHVLHPWIGQVIMWWPTPWQAVQEAAWQALNTPFAQDYSLNDDTPR